MENKKYFLGLDIGTDSVGYAVTDKEYNLLKFHGKPAWGVTLFDEADLSATRRSFRTARRRLDRRNQRVSLVQELFAGEIAKVDERFFVRLRESALFREDAGDNFTLFNDPDYTDKEYHQQYPTIHHLINELMTNDKPHDVRLVYLAVAWLVKHRGHFLSNIDKNNLASIKDFGSVYVAFMSYFTDNGYKAPWGEIDITAFSNILKKKAGVTNKTKELITVLCDGKKPGKLSKDEEIDEEFPFSLEGIIKLLAGGTYSLKDLFGKDEYDTIENKSVCLSFDDDKMGQIMADIGEDYDLISALRSLYDWSVLVDALGDSATVSQAKVRVYEQHNADLKVLKSIICEYKPDRLKEVFDKCDNKLNNYVKYTHHTDKEHNEKWSSLNAEDFSKYILSVVKDIEVKEKDKAKYDDMISRLELRTFLPKQKTTDNRVIPHQLYWYELKTILENASEYLPFLSAKDEDGLSVSEKLLSIFMFRIPYFVGPLNRNSENSWFVRKAEGKIYPWNFEKLVDEDESENAFIKRMTNTCTYLPGEPVLPKDSLLYHRFTVLNEINNLKINGERISVELKQRIYNEVFLEKKKVTKKYLLGFLLSNGFIKKGEEDSVTGIDININSNLIPQIAFKSLIGRGVLSEADVERIIERASFAEDKSRLSKWIDKEYPQISDDDKKYIVGLKLKDFGRLSKKFLFELEGTDYATGEVTTIISALWNSQNNLMEIVADESKYSFKKEIEAFAKEYYSENPSSLEDRLSEMYISNAVKRPVYRTLAIVKDIEKAFGKPEKIFVEMTRGASEEQKGKRTVSRKQQILDLYKKCNDEDVKELRARLEEMGDYAENKLQGDKLFLYYMQLGRCMYTKEPIDLDKLGSKEYYDIDHIYPQAYVKDDSIINNKVLVLSSANGEKSDTYPIKDGIRSKMHGFWGMLKEKELISEEKYKRLTRATPFTAEEKYGFINRQLTETSQSTKAVATLLKEKYPDCEIVYCKAKLTSEFRQEFDLLKSRTFNDLHHAVDAYLNIVTGNVYHMKFTSKWFNINNPYSIKLRTIFSDKKSLVVNGETVWNGEKSLAKVKATAVKNNAHFTKFAYFKKGGFFDQMPVPADVGLVPRKKDLPSEKYGGYNKPGAMFYIPVRYKLGKKNEVIIMSVELLAGNKFLNDADFAKAYCFERLEHILGKRVENVSFPMGMRPWKVNTCLSLDGFRVCIAGIGSGGKCLVAQPVMQFCADKFWQYYLKKLEMFDEKSTKNSNYIYSSEYDKIDAETNLNLYDLYLDKLKNSVYSKRVNCPVSILENGREKFAALDIKQQAKALLNIHQVFGRLAGGIDLTLIGGAGKAAATVNFSSTVSNWKKVYSDVRIVDSSVTGLWQKESENLLELL